LSKANQRNKAALRIEQSKAELALGRKGVIAGSALALLLAVALFSLAGSDADAAGVSAGSGNDLLSGTSRADTQAGLAGNDTLNGGPGSDSQFGGAGNDTLNGGGGGDTQVGGSGNDVLRGGPGNDLLVGGAGDDTINCGTGNDTVYSGPTDLVQGCQGPGDEIVARQPQNATAPLSARLQWNANFGYCGETSFIAAGMSLGQYTSQWTARKLANPGIAQTRASSQLLPEWPTRGGNFLPAPVSGQDWQTAAAAMSLEIAGFNTYAQMAAANGLAASKNFLAWIKTEVVAGNRVIIGVFNNPLILEESGSGANTYDHVVPVFSVGSSKPFASPGSAQTYYGSDTITISDNGLYSPFGPNTPAALPAQASANNFGSGSTAGNQQYSTLYTGSFSGILEDRGGANTYTAACSNCASDGACNASCSPYVYSIYDNTAWSGKHATAFPANLGNYGVSISGVADPGGVTVPVSLKLEDSSGDLLNNEGANPGNSNHFFSGPVPGKPAVGPSRIELEALVSSLVPGSSYNLYLYDSFAAVPTTGFNANSAQATESWKLAWDIDKNSWSTVSSTAQGWVGSCTGAGRCKISVSSIGTGAEESALTSKGSYIFRAVPTSAP